MPVSTYLIYFGIAAGLVLLFLFIRWLLGIWKLATLITRLTPEILESVPFFKLVDMLLGRSHAMERHSPLTKIEQHKKRAQKGITPEGIQLNPVHSGRWNSYYIMLHIIDVAQNLWLKNNTRRKECYIFRCDKIIGTVIKQFTKEAISTRMAFVVINKKGEVVTAFPMVESENNENAIVLNINENEIIHNTDQQYK